MHNFVANFLRYNNTKYYWNRSTFDGVITKIRGWCFFEHSVYNSNTWRSVDTSQRNLWTKKSFSFSIYTVSQKVPTCIFSRICKKTEFLISRGSVATCLRWGGQCRMGFVANSIRFPQCKNSEDRLRFDKVTESSKVRDFFETQYSVWNDLSTTVCSSSCILRQFQTGLNTILFH